jgi:cytosine/adenosine deaminase-related metal-dependent hydrolase
LLEAVDAWDPSWIPPGCGPVEYLARLGVLDARLLAVHGVQLTDAELAALGDVGATLATCPRSNEWTGAGRAPLDRFYASGVRVAFGTDSLASVATLSLFDELAFAHRRAPAVPAKWMVRSATLGGAKALGRDDEFGSLEAGRSARVIAVDLPAAALDERVAGPEPWLLEGVTPARVSWPASEAGGDA